jgi:hypothetical protein
MAGLFDPGPSKNEVAFMRRILLVLTIAAILVVAMALPAFADAKPPHASCIGVLASGYEGRYGAEIPAFSTNGGVGQFFNKENRDAYYGGNSPNC